MSTEREDFFGDFPAPPPPVEPQRPRPLGPRGRSGRVVALAIVLVVAVAVGVVDHVVHRASAAPPPPIPVGSVPPADVESSVWYCAGATSTAGSAGAMTINLTNTTGRPVAGTLQAVSEVRQKNGSLEPGRRGSETLVVPGDTEITEVPGTLVGGDFVAATVTLDGGGVLATQSVAGPLGWSESSCSRSTAANWYFASGATEQGDTLYLALYNPTTTEAVVDTTFVIPAGIRQPEPFEGIVIPPGGLATEQIDSFVQDAPTVSTIVTARTGAVVAAELEARAQGSVGLSVRLGVPAPSRSWVLPRSIDVAGGTTAISVFNPTAGIDRVVVTVRPGILTGGDQGVVLSPPATFTRVIGPQSTWVFETSNQTRIPTGLAFLATVRVTQGPGVVVDRSVVAPAKAAKPQFGATTALAISPPGTLAVMAGPGNASHPPVPGAVVDALDLANPGRSRVSATVWALNGRSGRVRLTTVAIPGTATLAVGLLGNHGRFPVEVTTDGQLGVAEDMAPGAVDGVITLGAAPASR